ncbi:MAG: AAA family ATPase, partial [Bacteroidia bacterium]
EKRQYICGVEVRNINISNFKSIRQVSITEPNDFTVFVGANASGKSSIFEAIEFLILHERNSGSDLIRTFGSINDIFPKNLDRGYFDRTEVSMDLGYGYVPKMTIQNNQWRRNESSEVHDQEIRRDLLHNKFIENGSRIFIGGKDRFNITDGVRLNTSCNNLERVLKRLLKDEERKTELIEWLSLFIPGFENLEIHSSELSGEDTLLIYETGTDKPFNRHLISDGTFNIITLLTAVHQSYSPQFLCIEEPENGLNPKVVNKLVEFFRYACQKYGHTIWLNTHSQSLIRSLNTNEVILVDKKDGITHTRQIKEIDLHGMTMDEALLTNSLGGGIPW